MYAIETENITKKYNNQLILKDMNLKVPQGIIFGLLGKNGAGKSTFINILTGLISPTDGQSSLLSRNVNDIKNFQRNIGVLPDYSTFYDDYTAIDHLKYFNGILGAKKTKKELLVLLEKVGLGNHSNIKTKKFSFGMKKKLGIAQALINDPQLLFLDEPTSGVDVDSSIQLQNLIKNIASSGTTVFLTSHNLSEIEKLCDEIIIMKEGSIKLQGTLTNLKDEFAQVVKVHIKHNDLNIKKQEELSIRIKGLCHIESININNTLLSLESSINIPEINRIFVNLNIDVFHIYVEQPSLEEIFLNM